MLCNGFQYEWNQPTGRQYFQGQAPNSRVGDAVGSCMAAVHGKELMLYGK